MYAIRSYYERETAVAVLLGDRDDQAQVAAGQLALGLLVLLEVHLDLLQAPLEPIGGLQRHELELAQALRITSYNVCYTKLLREHIQYPGLLHNIQN